VKTDWTLVTTKSTSYPNDEVTVAPFNFLNTVNDVTALPAKPICNGFTNGLHVKRIGVWVHVEIIIEIEV
jgi:hypothetical protein